MSIKPKSSYHAYAYYHRQHGVLLIELIMAIVIVSTALLGISSVINLTLEKSADPLVVKQRMLIADGLMEEILSKAYNDPGVGHTATGQRQYYDDINDYSGFHMEGIRSIDGTPIPELAEYNVSVSVTPASLPNGTVARLVRIEVKVNRYDDYVLESYRTAYE